MGSTFNNPRMNFSGSYQDSNAYYTVGGNANGLPTGSDARGTTGEVPLCMPAGDYIVDTMVSAQSENGLVAEVMYTTKVLAASATARPSFLVEGRVIRVRS